MIWESRQEAMVTEKWYRNENWDAKIEEAFFAHLARSRSQRDQYLVIQAITIAQSFPHIALRLVAQYFATKKSAFDDVRALGAKADAYLALEDIAGAVSAMKSVLEVERLRPSHKTNTYVDYPYLVATKRIASEYSAALAILAERAGDLMFPMNIFKWHASMSIICAELKEIDLAKTHAGLALDAALVTKSGFSHHQDLGLVGDKHEAILTELRGIYA